jgi:hypothetical protein
MATGWRGCGVLRRPESRQLFLEGKCRRIGGHWEATPEEVVQERKNKVLHLAVCLRPAEGCVASLQSGLP